VSFSKWTSAVAFTLGGVIAVGCAAWQHAEPSLGDAAAHTRESREGAETALGREMQTSAAEAPSGAQADPPGPETGPYPCKLPSGSALAPSGEPIAREDAVLATVQAGRQALVPVMLNIPPGVGVISAQAAVLIPGNTLSDPLTGSLVSIDLPRTGETAVIRFSASAPGRYRVVAQASAYPPSDCPGLGGVIPRGDSEHPASRDEQPAASPTPATWANSTTVATLLGIILVRPAS